MFFTHTWIWVCLLSWDFKPSSDNLIRHWEESSPSISAWWFSESQAGFYRSCIWLSLVPRLGKQDCLVVETQSTEQRNNLSAQQQGISWINHHTSKQQDSGLSLKTVIYKSPQHEQTSGIGKVEKSRSQNVEYNTIFMKYTIFVKLGVHKYIWIQECLERCISKC